MPGYLRSNRKVLAGITDFISNEQPDIVGLIEVDTGSIRTGMVNQAEHIANHLGHYSTFQCKYGVGSINKFMPIVRKQGNAFLSAPHIHGERFHYFDQGIKRLIIELELEHVCVFLVHLSLKFRHRQYQLRSLHDLDHAVEKTGHRGRGLQYVLGHARDLPLHARRWPAQCQHRRTALLPLRRVPRIELDFILVSQDIEITDFRVPDVRFSDHRPLICDFNVRARNLQPPETGSP